MAVVNHQQISLARDFRGYSQENLAGQIGIKQGTLSKIEKGVLEPSIELVNRMADTLNLPNTFFYEDISYLGLPATFFRRRMSVSQQFLKRIAAQINVSRLHLKKILDAFHLDSFKALHLDGYRGAQEIAKKYRQTLGIPAGPIANLTEIIEQHGIIVIRTNLGTNLVDGFSIVEQNMPPLIFMNHRIPGDRWRWTIAHELAHIVLHGFSAQPEQDKDIEVEAHAFAAEFLMPAEDIRGYFATGFNLTKAAGLKPFWKVSIQALIMRAADLGYLSQHQKARMMAKLGLMGYRKTEPNTVPQEQPRMLRAMVDYFLSSMGISLDGFCKMISIQPAELTDLYPGIVNQKPQLRLFE